MTTWSTPTRDASTWGNQSQDNSTWMNMFENRSFNHLLTESGGFLLQETGFKIILEQSNPTDAGWVNQNES